MHSRSTGPQYRPHRPPRPRWRFIVLALIIGLLGLGLALTIPLTMPMNPLMLLRVGASELSLWLVGLNLLGILLSLLARGSATGGAFRVAGAALVFSLLGLILSSIPVAQLPVAIIRADAAMQASLGPDYA